MPDHGHSDPPFWINDKDDKGQPLDADVVAAAKRIWCRALALTRFRLHDVSRSAEILELTAAAVSRALRRRPIEPAVRDIDAYLLYAFIRRLHRVSARERRLQPVSNPDTLTYSKPEAGRLLSEVESSIQVQELLSYMDSATRRMATLRMEGYPWKHIAQKLGFKDRHSAEVQFNKGCRAARLRMTRASSTRADRRDRS
jgi:hypothetical protein